MLDVYESDEELTPEDTTLQPSFPGIARYLPSFVHRFNEHTIDAWRAQMTTTVLPALADTIKGKYGYIVRVSTPHLDACVDGCACLAKKDKGCHFIVINRCASSVYGIRCPYTYVHVFGRLCDGRRR